MTNPRYELTELVIEEASLVDKGDNPKASVALFKSMHEEEEKNEHEEEEESGKNPAAFMYGYEKQPKKKGHLPFARRATFVERAKRWMNGEPQSYEIEQAAIADFGLSQLRDSYLSSVDSIFENVGHDGIDHWLAVSTESFAEAVHDLKENDQKAVEVISLVDSLKSSLVEMSSGTAHVNRGSFVDALEEIKSFDLDGAASGSQPETEETVSEIEKKESSVDDVLKGLPEDQRAVISEALKSVKANEEMKSRLELTEQKLAKMLDEKRTAEFASKARAMSIPGVEVEKMGEILKRAHELDEKLSSDIETVFAAMSAQSRKSAAILSSIGHASADGNADLDGESGIEKRAREIAKNESLTFEQAYVQALRENPDLYTLTLGNAVDAE